MRPDKAAVIDGARRHSWHQLRQRALGLAAGLRRHCPAGSDTVAVLAANVSELFELLFAAPAAGETLGELMMRGNLVMKGYLKNPQKTSEAFARGWFHTGDLGVVEPDGYVRIKDRAKDIIISGGENISSIEIESLLLTHGAIAAAAVAAAPDPQWGETPCAFIELHPQQRAPSEEDLLTFCRAHLPHFKCPRRFVFSSLPRTSTGKIQKFALRQQAAKTS